LAWLQGGNPPRHTVNHATNRQDSGQEEMAGAGPSTLNCAARLCVSDNMRTKWIFGT
jgi:hypothetical protein